jgi:hypothetical protein
MKAPALSLTLAACLLHSAAAHAADAVGAFASGDFAAARMAGRAAGSAKGMSLACEAGLVLGSYLEKGEARIRTLHGAIEDCAQAIRSGGAGVGPYVNYAIGFGFEAKRLHSVSAASASKKLFAEAVARFPDNGFAHAALAGWHSNVTRQAGLGRIALGASRDEARRGFATAVSLDPENPVIRFEQLRFLAAGDRKDRSAAADTAAVIATMKPRDAFDALILEKTKLLAAALSRGEKDIDAAIAATEPFAGVRGEAPHLKFEPPFRASFPPSRQQG